MTKVLTSITSFVAFTLLTTSCSLNYSIEDMNNKAPSTDGSNLSKFDKVYVDLTELTLTEGSVAIINVAVNPVRSTDTQVKLSLTSPTSTHIRFNPIPVQITIPAGLTSKSVILNSIDDSLVQSQEIWNFNITPSTDGVVAEPGKLVITLNDNDGGFIPNAPTTTPIPKILTEINSYPAPITGSSLQNKVIFRGADAANGYELWVSDGTTSGSYLLKDINPGIDSSSPDSFVKSEDESYVLFLATTANEGRELWRTDGTPEGTFLLKDFAPGPQSNNISIEFTKADKVFFVATDPVYGTEINITDGTINGTHVLKDIIPGASSNLQLRPSFVFYNNEIYFSYNDQAVNFQTGIWKTDGTDSGTTKVINGLSSGTAFTYYEPPNNFKEINGKLIFSSRTAPHGYEMFVTNGTTAGTTLLKDFYTTSFADSYGGSTGDVFNSKASIVISYDDNTSSGIWLTDGTPAGTTKLSVPVNIHSTGTLGVVNEKLIFTGSNPSTGEYEPWVTDGTVPGTLMLKDINPGNDANGNPRSSAPRFVAKLGNKLIFSASSVAEGTELWVTDGTPAGTMILSDIIPGSLSSYTNNYKVLNNKLYFSAYHLSYGNELWVTDGTPSGTKLFRDVIPGTTSSGPVSLFGINNNSGLLFAAYNTSAQFGTLHSTDLTDSGSSLPISHTLIESNGSSTNFFSYNQGHVFFNAKDTSNGNPLWVTDGTKENTYKVKDLFPNSACLDVGSIHEVNGILIFAGSDDTHGKELWTTDGTEGGTYMIKDLDVTSANSLTNPTFVPDNTGSKFYFSATDSNGLELWVTDGTSTGTTMVKDLYTGSTGGSPNNGIPSSITFVPGINEFLFSARKSSDGRYYVFRSDGTSAGTVEVTGFGTYSVTNFYKTDNSVIIKVTDSSLYRLYSYDKVAKSVTLLNTTYSTDKISSTYYNSRLDKLIYSTSNSTGTSHKIWATDGTVGGTVTLATIPTASYNSSSMNFILDNGSVALLSYNFSNLANRGEIWMTDGTPGGTSKVTALSQSVQFQLVDDNGLFYFLTATTAEGNELWVTNGTAPGTKMLKDINPGSGDSSPNNFVKFNGQVYFTARDIDHGIELWRTNGQSSGTELVYDINPGKENSSPSLLTPIGNTLYFKATKILSGNENWTYTP